MTKFSVAMQASLAAITVFAVAAATHEPFRLLAAQQGFCNMTQDGLAACKPAIMGPEPAPNPTDMCCSALMHADLNCLCSYKNSGWLTFIRINPELAMQLPAKCNITPPEKC